MKPPRLTAFQSLMREWSTLAPYNFIHAMRFDAPLDIGRWQSAVTATMQKLDLTSAAVRLDQPSNDIETHLRSELHRPFLKMEAPIRFFAIKENEVSHWFGATINHWFADDYSCRILLQQIYAKYKGDSLDVEFEVARPNSVPGGWWRNWSNFIKQAMQMRHACRTPVRDPMDFDVRVFRAVLPDGALEAGRAVAKRHGATLHDLFLAATAQTFSAARLWEPGSRRDRVAMVSAMDLRRFDPESSPNRFGLIIGHYIVIEQRPHECSLGEVIKNIAAQSRRFKTDSKTNPQKPALFLWRLPASKRSRATHYQRGAPLVAGLSNVNLTGSWIEQAEIQEFRRIGPTGPVIPMVLMITTLRGRIFFDVTYRTTAFNSEAARAVVNEIIQRLPT